MYDQPGWAGVPSMPSPPCRRPSENNPVPAYDGVLERQPDVQRDHAEEQHLRRHVHRKPVIAADDKQQPGPGHNEEQREQDLLQQGLQSSLSGA